MLHVKVCGAKLNLSSAIFGCVLNRCYKGAGRCAGLIESWPCSLNAMKHYNVCMFLSPYIQVYLCYYQSYFQTAVQGGDARHMCLCLFPGEWRP